MNELYLTPSPLRALLARALPPGAISLGGGMPDPALFPAAGLAAAAAAAFADGTCLQYAASEGLPALRQAVAARLAARGLATDPSQVFIVNGSQHGLQLALRLLAGAGSAVALEAPAYPGARQAAELAGAAVHDVALDADGLPDARALTDTVARARSAGAPLRALVTMPTARNPTGRTLDAPARVRLAALAAAHGLALVEDEAYADLWYDAPPPAPLAMWHADTILCGSFSKIVAPGLRLGWLRVPPALAESAGLLVQATCLHANGVAQHTLARWLATGGLAAHLAGLRAAYATKRAALAAAVARHLPGCSCIPPQGGMFLWLGLPPGVRGHALATAALAHGVQVVPGGAFFAGSDGTDDHLRLSFATQSPELLDEGARRLAVALASLAVARAAG